MSKLVSTQTARSLSRAIVISLFGMLVSSQAATAWTLKVIHSFADAYPGGKLIQDSTGNLYGAANLYGGAFGSGNGGVVFKLTPNGDKSAWHYNVLHAFCLECSDGGQPVGTLTMDAAGNLYGVTFAGGTADGGVIYKLSPRGKYDILYALCASCGDGNNPYELTYKGAAQGSLYDGISPLYGLNQGRGLEGVVFSLQREKGAWKYSVLHGFCVTDCNDGREPAGLVVNSAGDLYGVAGFGGKHQRGLVFRLSPNDKHQWTESDLYDFRRPDRWPNDLSIASDESLVGVTVRAGPDCKEAHVHNQCGVLFSFNPQTSRYRILHGFCSLPNCIDGRIPLTASELQPGKILGVTVRGGQSDNGTVFQFQDGNLQSIYQFCSLQDCQDGSHPAAGLTPDASGSFFGTTLYGGAYGFGEVFELSP
jgi:uncharacterized repeat protein (TIGR03803 family)